VIRSGQLTGGVINLVPEVRVLPGVFVVLPAYGCLMATHRAAAEAPKSPSRPYRHPYPGDIRWCLVESADGLTIREASGRWKGRWFSLRRFAPPAFTREPALALLWEVDQRMESGLVDMENVVWPQDMP
jgi:hypothetical protein